MRPKVEEQTGNVGLYLPGLIVAPGWLRQRLDRPGLRLLDVRSRQSYEEGHIPGAVHVELAALSREIDGVSGMLLTADSFANQMSKLGVDHDSAVVIYDDNWGMPAARVLWALAYYGHQNTAVLTGGSDRWQEEGHPWTADPAPPRLATFNVQLDESHLADRDWLLNDARDADVVLVDTRAAGEYAAGHLPGAVRWDWINGVPVGSWDTVRPAAELRPELVEKGITPDKEIVTYCQSGVRAAHTYLLLRHLGYPRVRVYDGSWLDWSRYLDESGEGANDRKS